jgi:hypothetical protein
MAAVAHRVDGFPGIRLVSRRILRLLEGEHRAANGRLLGVAHLVRARARWHIAILSKNAAAGHEYVTGPKIGRRRCHGGIARVVRDASPGLMVRSSERGVRVRARRVAVPSIVDGSDHIGCEKAEHQNESCESVLGQHDSFPLLWLEGVELGTRAGAKSSLRGSPLTFSGVRGRGRCTSHATSEKR